METLWDQAGWSLPSLEAVVAVIISLLALIVLGKTDMSSGDKMQ